MNRSAKKSFKFFSNIEKSKKSNSWASPWSISILDNKGICIYPNINLITNIGYVEDSAHCFNPNDTLSNNKNYNLEKISHPSYIIISLGNEEDKFINRFYGMTLEDYIEYLESQNEKLNEELLELKDRFYIT